VALVFPFPLSLFRGQGTTGLALLSFSATVSLFWRFDVCDSNDVMDGSEELRFTPELAEEPDELCGAILEGEGKLS
jgi:hypothetical protein